MHGDVTFNELMPSCKYTEINDVVCRGFDWNVAQLSYSMIVLHSRDHKGVDVAHEITSPKN